ncbi:MULTISPECIES: tol-pal system-associated acyl-CoA thioesterase [Zoogloea]|jgi:acyl-CoA thioester hydrolase|uniref:Tol-pal system-associated acyl-CoA thioesterase n=1 Tax=Zoogloea oleivorans TaxID=1552750 RepID=A0A6C2D120_9RHOO|nr:MULTISPECIES: tol-pal system-associated acyl-CoA thioesterase [Zoogloea]MDD2667481.1 tol-pal system-associated acyl-CoA thioesterase [Zoogloea sp.]MDY0035720.1 tol-pal system-associated acyl-CoA thioesterase [Zoogloea oleivorans]TYC60210.1 tol-pal system-associated acyl-CoA thioesterase [Zoogloea oleivorans]
MHATNHPAPGEGEAFFSLPVRVYYEDTDAGGVVYYANYLKFCERARTDWLRAMGFEQNRLYLEQDIVFVVRTVKADYLQAAVLDDLLNVVTTIDKLGHASLVFAQTIRRDDKPLFEALITIACVNRVSKRATPIPPAVRAQFATLVQTR